MEWFKARKLDTAISVLACLGSLIALYRFFSASLPLLDKNILSVDLSLYAAVGRGFMNGHKIYVDLFETKPPFIYMLSALSLGFGGYTLLKLLGIFSLLLPALMFWKKQCIGVMFGVCLAVFMVSRTYGYQPEGFGAVFGIAVFFVFTSSLKTMWKKILMGLFIALSVYTKEPFILAIFGGFVMLAGKKDIPMIAWSLVFSFCIWMVLQFLSGTLVTYFTIYLPELLFGRVIETSAYHDELKTTFYHASNSLWMRGLNMYGVIMNFPVALPLVFGALFLQKKWWVSAIALGGIIYSLHIFFALEQISQIVGHIPFFDSFFFWKIIEMIAYAGAGLTALFYSPSTFQSLVALYFMSMSVSVAGDYFDHHFLFAIPTLVAPFFTVGKERLRWIAIPLLLQCVLVPRMEYRYDYVSQQRAQKLDAIMDACGYERYFQAEHDELSGFTRYSPYNLQYEIVRASESVFGNPSEFMKEKSAMQLQEAQITIGRKLEGFTEDPPACAGDGMKGVYFRIQ